MDMEITPAGELERRNVNLQEKMREQGMSGALLLQRADLFYFSGTAQDGHLFIPAEGDPLLLVRRNLQRARSESALQQIEAFTGWGHLAKAVQSMAATAGPIGLELDLLPVNHFRRYEKLLAPLSIMDVSPSIRTVRAVKSDYELEQLRRAAALSEAVFRYAREICRVGLKEIELAAALESFARLRGHQGAIRMRSFNQELFFSHILAGESAAVPSFFNGPLGGTGLNPSYPQGAGLRKIRQNEPVLVDFVTVLGGYMVDQTRIFCPGKPAARPAQAYATALQIKKELIPMGKDGANGADLYRRAFEIASAAGLEDHFMGAEEKVSFIGHGVGLELDELPVIARNHDYTLREGMVFALEPKFVFPGEGAVGIEDTFAVRDQGLEQITRFDDALQIL